MTARSPTMVMLYDTRFVECRWWSDGWTVKTVVTSRSSASMIPAPDVVVAPIPRTAMTVCCWTSQQHASVSQGRICSDNFTCCHTETEAADQTFYLTQSQYIDTRLTSPSTDPINTRRLAG